MTFSTQVIFQSPSRATSNFFWFSLQTNASIVRDLAAAVARVAPTAHVLVISNPVNSTVPIVAATLEKAGVFDPAHLFGVTTLDVVRAARFLAGISNASPSDTPATLPRLRTPSVVTKLLPFAALGYVTG